jgi:hypothetical protein
MHRHKVQPGIEDINVKKDGLVHCECAVYSVYITTHYNILNYVLQSILAINGLICFNVYIIKPHSNKIIYQYEH